MPKYAAILYRNESINLDPKSPEAIKVYQAWAAFRDEIGKAGVMKFGNGLQPTSTATTVRIRDGKPLMTDGPFAETREQLAGFLVFECKNLDEAIQWALKVPDALTGSVEVRPFWEG